MSRTIETTVYSFEELSDEAKETAREWYRQGALEYDWSEFVIEDAANIAGLFGLDLKQRPVKLMNGDTRYEPSVYFSGFSSQGDGACFEGQYYYKKGALKAVKDYAPTDEKLHRIVKDLQSIQRRHFYRLTAAIEHYGRYYHSGCMTGNVYINGDYADNDTHEAVWECFRDFADWIYRRLEAEHDYILSDEQVDESIACNEYEFDEDGNIA
jgi:hypothetical protein